MISYIAACEKKVVELSCSNKVEWVHTKAIWIIIMSRGTPRATQLCVFNVKYVCAWYSTIKTSTSLLT